MLKFLYIFLIICPFTGWTQVGANQSPVVMTTPFERSNGMQTATYFECIDFYKQLDKLSPKLTIREMGMSDAGYPYQVVLYSGDGQTDPNSWHKNHKVVILINNGIHPGEPDGVDASMMLLRDLVAKKIVLPDNIALAVIPLYNIGGALNRGSFSRANQNGPESYGFRGNAQNLDLNRDFTKCDSRNARAFAQIFHWVDPDIQMDNHVSDGADYQYTMTLLASQWNKLGGELGKFLHDIFQPGLYRSMEKKGWPMTPYVNFEDGSPENGWVAFYDPPRYSSGYATLFNTIAFMPETHMLKPFRDRVMATYALELTMIEQASLHAGEIIEKRKKNFNLDLLRTEFPLGWKPDTSRFDLIAFKGYEASHKTSEVTGLQRLYYDHSRPFEKQARFFDYFSPDGPVTAPEAYLLPQGWHEVADLLALNGVRMQRLVKDTMIDVEAYHIDDYRSSTRAYEKHHRNTGVQVTNSRQSIQFLKGDYLIPTSQSARRFLIEMLEPLGDDSYFSWNFFDAVLQEKEGYSAYRWEDLSAAWLKDHPDVREKLEDRKKNDAAFSQNAEAQLEFVYRRSPYYEPAHLRYPVYRVPAAGRAANDKSFISYNDKNIYYQGRIGREKEVAEFYWAGTSATINFSGTGVSAILKDADTSNYYTIVVDGKPVSKIHPDTLKRSYALASGLPDIRHTVELFKRTELYGGPTAFYGFELDKEAKLLPPIPTPKRKIEFYGNSISCGYADEDSSGKDRGIGYFENNYIAYPALTARHFHAGYTCIAKSGIGVMVSWFPLIMPEMYGRLNPADPDSQWDFSRNSPDLVVINLFQNDSWIVEKPDHEQFKARFGDKKPDSSFIIGAYRHFLAGIRDKYPNAHIICVLGNMDASRANSPWPGYIAAAVAALQDKKIYTHFFAYKGTPGHPNAAEQQAMAESLIHFIEQNINW
jgi:Carbohydrate esterase 2 N-terminal/Zinc carboxypeptidase